MILFGGLMVNPSTVFVWLRWLQWLSPIRYCFECLCIAQWGGNEYTEMIYQVELGFGTTLTYWYCIACLTFLVILFRVASILALKNGIRKFQ